MRFLDETDQTARRLRDLLRTHGLQGKQIHDANLVATMLANGVETIVTQNPGDFRAFEGVISTLRM